MITIRNAASADRDVIVEYQLAMALETEDLQLEKATVQSGVDAVFFDPEKGRYFVAEKNGRVVGSLLVTFEWSDWRNGMVFWIQSVYVEQEFRKNGIFKSLYQHIKNIVLSSKEFVGIRLYVDKTNHDAQKVYSGLGMNGDHYKVFEWMGD